MLASGTLAIELASVFELLALLPFLILATGAELELASLSGLVLASLKAFGGEVIAAARAGVFLLEIVCVGVIKLLELGEFRRTGERVV